MKVKRLILSDSISNSVSFGRGNTKRYLTIHQTGNTSRGANAQAHHNLQARGFSYGWHWQVDDKEAIQSHSHDYKIWHAGDGTGSGNSESIGVEICVNSDGNYRKSVENGAKLAALILKDEGIPIERMVQHNHWTGKDCPQEIRACKDGICWSDFVGLVTENLKENSWKKNDSGWWYEKSDGSYPKNKWEQIDGIWYYFDGRGYAYQNQWLQYEGKWYYFDNSCQMVSNSWKKIDDNWFYFDENGYALQNRWLKYKDEWYYFGEDGSMLSNQFTTIGSETFYLNSWGVCDLNYVREIDGRLYAFNDRGALIKDKVIDKDGVIKQGA